MTPRRAVAALIAGLLAVACAAPPPEDAGFPEVRALVAERTGAELEWARDADADRLLRERISALIRDSQGELTRERAIQVALLANPRLHAKLEDLGVARADLVQAGLLSNPEFEVEVRFPGQATEVHAIQDLVEAFTIPLRERVAAAELERARLDVAAAAIEAAAEAGAAFYDLQGAQQVVELRRTVLDAQAAGAEAARRLHDAGNVTDLELANAEVQERVARLDLAEAEADVLEKRERLNAAMGLFGGDTAWTIASRLPDLPADEIARDGLESRAVAGNLALAAARREIEAIADRLGLTRSTALFPRIDAGLHLESEPDGEVSVGPSVGLGLPLFDRGQGRIARDEALLRQAERRYYALAVELRCAVRRLHDRMIAKRDRTEYCRQVVLPLRRRIVDETQLQYNAMQLGVFELLRSRHDEVEAGREYIVALRDYWLARAELEPLLGGPPSPAPDAPASHEHDRSGESQ